MSDYSLYWIHLPDHKDPYTEGYIGITQDMPRREKDHKLYFAEYFEQGAMVEVIQSNMSRADAVRIEGVYRPAPNIGWNTQSGSVKGTAPRTNTTINPNTGWRLVNMRLPAELWDEFGRVCENSGKSRAEVMRDMMRDHIDNEVNPRQLELF